MLSVTLTRHPVSRSPPPQRCQRLIGSGMLLASFNSSSGFPGVAGWVSSIPGLWAWSVGMMTIVAALAFLDRRFLFVTFPFTLIWALGCFDQSLSGSGDADFVRSVLGLRYAFHLFASGCFPFLLAGVLLLRSFAGWRHMAATE